MTSLIEEMSTTAEAEKTAAQLEYRKIVNRSAKPEPGDAKAILRLLNLLGLTDLTADVEAVARANSLRASILTEEQTAAQQQPIRAEIAEADRDRRNQLAELARNVADPFTFYHQNLQSFAGGYEFQAAHQRMNDLSNQLRADQASRRDDRMELNRLVGSNPRVLTAD